MPETTDKSMRIPITKSLIHVLFGVLLASSCLADVDGPFILANKKATLNRLKSGVERVSVSIDIYNQGSSTAYDVTVADDSWPEDMFEIVSGNTSMSWERLDAGGLLSYSFELDGKVKGLFYGSPARVTFRIPTKAAPQEAYSTPILSLDVLAERTPEKKFDWAKRLLAEYGSVISAVSIVVLFVRLVSTPSSKGSKKKR
ncbi:hypothetical protein K2173_028239 [Erythroxylum novogranatense]|uniref:Translocon-associated protein subunit beta n=1 Tax=Erythroxylum novogranatense TaxID=1862640 RepID=A0AAV8U185_9ROSI|nr:hypothetical protein K2173_028239 [Erythroxylum novogranatense]